MINYYRSLKSDFIKLRRQPMLLVHLLIPLVGIGIFLAYFAYTPYSQASKVEGYMQALAAAFPTMIGIVCAIAADQESAAGQYQQFLTLPSRLVPLASKLSLLLLLGLGSVLLASAGFGAGFIYILNQSPYGLGFYVIAALILFGSSILLYALHFFVSLRFGKGASIGLGIVGSLTAALLLTGLGDQNWIYIPCAWAARLVTIWAQYGPSGAGSAPAALLLQQGILLCGVGTAAFMVLLGLWFRRWEGRKSLE
ncbi:lantibiotic immunity ABC transporter MutG family permease subunit [Paenibacillus sp. CAA11]|uniref:lantibiotic immunity ABC transporter MutG family permease subunit n=1 Tax=Paenibacillus sp. CAA11 TaxID=1532905 RepID=UPI000D3B171E|nr:lantibiotic immunity ABC transporter MutG family permease subunit [Paenibacillus sp. CAA11]AWB43496.1 lantibiotic immunity ABC transporter MutG family permease subunit [Paenibacillus sp. CAA11]